MYRALRILIGVVLAIAVLGFLAAPPLVRYVAVKKGSEALGRQVSIDKVRINPFALSMAVEGLRIADADGKSPFASVRRLDANVELFASAYRGGLVLNALRVEQPDIRFARLADQRFSFSDILDRFAAQPKPAEAGKPFEFALNNIELKRGHIEFDDRPVGEKHVVDKLAIGLPFVSNIPSQVEVLVQPHLEAEINGTELSLKGRVKPFADRREATLDLSFDPLDVTRYLAYAPGGLPIKIEHGLLTSNLELVWAEQANGGQTLALRGEAALSEVRALSNDGSQLMAWRRLQVGMQDLQPLASPMKLAFSKVLLVEPELSVQRQPDGSLNLQHLTDKPSRPKAARPASAASAPLAATRSATSASSAPAPLITAASVEIQHGKLNWRDDALSRPFAAQLSAIEASLQNYDSRGKPAKLKASLQADSSGTLTAEGQLNPAKNSYELQLALADLRVEKYLPYYADAIGPARPSASVAANTRLVIAPEAEGGLRLTNGSLQLTDLRLPELADVNAPTAARARAPGKPQRTSAGTPGKAPMVRIAALGITDFNLDLPKRRIDIGAISSRDARWHVLRDAEGINLLRAFGISTQAAAAGEPGMAPPAEASAAQAATSAAAAVAPWVITNGKTDLAGWNAVVEDRTGREPVRVRVEKLALQSSGMSTAKGSEGQIDLSFGVNRRGQLRLAGPLGVAPLKGKLKLEARAVELLFAQPYISQFTRVLVTQGALDARGTVAFDMADSKAPKVSWAGDVAVKDFNSFDEINETDFVRWKNFSLAKLDVNMAPKAPPALSAAELRLDEFYSRLILDAEGRFNLRELVRTGDEPATAASSSSSTSAAGSAPGSAPSTTKVRGGTRTTAVVAPAPANNIKLRIDQVVLNGGNVRFSDRFVKPNYDANLTEVGGTLKGLSSDPGTLADLSLKAFVEHSAPVEVSGQLNPLRQDRMLDIAAHVSDIDLTSVSTYAARYVGYGISKGKLSMDVKYRIRDRVLTAENRLTLNQLTFGERIDSPTATQLPVRLAVALLKDRNGVIDLNLPISGTLDDPQFSVGGIIVRTLLNLVKRAVTAPFALLGSMFGGGGEELSYIDFPVGTAELPANAQTKLASLAKALQERPALNLEIAGSADPVGDVPGLKRAQLDNELRLTKAAAMTKRRRPTGPVDSIVISPEEYPALLEQVYEEEKIEKPHNALGLEKSLPVPEMERILLAAIKVGPADLDALANRRAQVVRDALISEGKVPIGRLFIVDRADQGKARVDFSLK